MKRIILTIGIFLLSAQIGFAYDILPGMKAMPEIEQFVQYGKDLYSKNKNKPQKDVVEKTQNQHNPAQTDEWHTVYYDGMVITFYRAKSAPGDLLSKLILSDKKFNMPFDIRIGDKKEKVLKLLGRPTEIKGKELYYNLPYASLSESITFKFSKDTLKEVQWDFEID
jgi:hypothetical protein